ncbi:hypothetical protein [Sphingomonas sp.]|jgi:hypothetical protein|uniref:hypothetical protein n=1 Tax=Sphingomonas sp. TaxID=28214 RepID=UPI002DBE28BD|nr:hypothetical protein [Sphingomonas sp.]HEU4967683.1 hypothetical protein [Sphingomonas sp.]
MRGLLAVIAIIVLLLIIGVATGFLNINQTQEASLPKVQVEGGQAPAFDADVGDVDVGTKNETIQVPTIDVDTAKQDQKEDKDK